MNYPNNSNLIYFKIIIIIMKKKVFIINLFSYFISKEIKPVAELEGEEGELISYK